MTSTYLGLARPSPQIIFSLYETNSLHPNLSYEFPNVQS